MDCKVNRFKRLSKQQCYGKIKCVNSGQKHLRYRGNTWRKHHEMLYWRGFRTLQEWPGK